MFIVAFTSFLLSATGEYILPENKFPDIPKDLSTLQKMTCNSPFLHWLRLKPLDIEFMKQLHSKVNIVPVIAKADTLTKKEVLVLKQRIIQQIEENGIKVYAIPDCESDEDEDYKEQVCEKIK